MLCGMDAGDVVRALVDPQRVKVFAAIALGSADRERIGAATGIDARGVAAATAKLEAAGLVASGPDGLRVDQERLRELVRASSGTDTPDGEFAPFVHEGRLRALPSKRGKRHAVLAHVVETSFDAARPYDEAAVNAVLERWCEGSEVDHVAIRRYLIDHQLLFRVRGVYARSEDVLPAPGEAERYMSAIGLD